ncbi:hypothetical protein, partial [Bacillus subtilis]
PDEYLKKLYKTKKLVEKTSFSLQAEQTNNGLLSLFLNSNIIQEIPLNHATLNPRPPHRQEASHAKRNPHIAA